MAELGQEFSTTQKRLREHLASAPPEPEQNADLLEHLPQLGVDLNLLTPESLRVFLEAFRVEIRYDVRTGRNLKAEISAETLEELARQARQAEAVRGEMTTSISRGEGIDREGRAVSSRPRMIMGSS